MKLFYPMVLLLLGGISSAAFAQHHCLDDQGRKIFSDKPCAVNKAKDAPMTEEQQARARREKNRAVIVNKGAAPRELVVIYERCVRAIEANSQTLFNQCMGEPSEIPLSSAQWEQRVGYWKSIVMKNTYVTGGRIEGRTGILYIEGEQDGEIYSGQVEFLKHAQWRPKLNSIDKKRR